MAAEFAPGRAGWPLAGLAPGTLVGGYRLEERIGAGGVAVVFRATDEALSRTVALKVLAPLLAADEDFRERFIRESRAASMVDHPNIIPIYAAVLVDASPGRPGHPYLSDFGLAKRDAGTALPTLGSSSARPGSRRPSRSPVSASAPRPTSTRSPAWPSWS